MSTNAAYAYSWLIAKGFPPNSAAGIVGNLIQESGVNPRSDQQGGPGRGIAQWSEGARWDSLVAWANQNNKNIYSLDTQLEFMLHEMHAYGMVDKMQSMNNLRAATRYFMNTFERPDPTYANLSGRIQYATTLRERDPSVPTSAGKGDGKGGDGKGGNGNNNGNDKTSRYEYGFTKQFLEKHNEIDKLVNKAMDERWTLERFQAELKNTKWWRQTTTARQQWQVLLAEKPAEAERQVEIEADAIRRMASNMGVNLDHKEVMRLATNAARNQLSTEEIMSLVGDKYGEGKGVDESPTGQAAVTIDQLRNYAYEFGVRIDNATLERWVSKIISGEQTVEGLVDKIREQSKLMVGQDVGKLLDKGYTLRDVLDPYMNAASEELGVPTNQMKTADPLWMASLGTKKEGPLTMEEWTAKIRTEKKYGWDKTEKAQQQASILGSELGKLMGTLG